MGLKRCVSWGDTRIKFLKDNYYEGDKKFLISNLNATWDNIKSQAHKYRLKRSIEVKFKEVQKNGYSSKIELDFLKNDILEVVDSQTMSQVSYPETSFVLDYYSPKLDMYIEFNGDYWHGRNKTIEEMENSSSTQKQKIAKTMQKDILKNKLIPNLITIWESDLKKAIKDNLLNEFLVAHFQISNNTILFRDPSIEDLFK